MALALFQPAAEQQEEHEHGGGIEIHMAATQGHVHQGTGPRQSQGQGHRQIHARAAGAQAAPGALEERPAGVEHHRRGDQETGDAEHPGVDLIAALESAQVEGGGIHHRLHGAQARQGQPTQQTSRLAALIRFRRRVAGQGDAVTELEQPFRHPARGVRTVINQGECHGGQVGVHGHHPGDVAGGLLDQPATGGAGKAGKSQGQTLAGRVRAAVGGQQLGHVEQGQGALPFVAVRGGVVVGAAQTVVIVQAQIVDQGHGGGAARAAGRAFALGAGRQKRRGGGHLAAMSAQYRHRPGSTLPRRAPSGPRRRR